MIGEKLLGDCAPNATGRCLKAGHEFDGYYRQAEIAELVSFARDLGIRVIPEVEQPEHAYGYDFLSGPNGTGEIVLCSYSGAMLYNDPANKTVTTLKRIMSEMAGLFPDGVFHMGAAPAEQNVLGCRPHCGVCLHNTAVLEMAQIWKHEVEAKIK